MTHDPILAPPTAGSGRPAALTAVLTVAATYVFFLLYAQFAFLKLLDLRLGPGAGIERAMAAMGLVGLAASLATGALLRRVAARPLLLLGFAGCGTTALIALGVTSAAGLTAVAAFIGLWTAVTTVTLATSLRNLVPAHRFGVLVGLGTGLAYLVCNLPPLFEGSPETQSLAAAAACGLGLAAVLLSRRAGRDSGDLRGLSAADYAGWGFAGLLVSFLALVWLDSAAFAVIQETLTLKGQTWASSGQKLVQGGVHALAAVAAGWLIDRGVFRALPPVTFVLFTASFLALGDGSAGPWWAGPMYAVGISLYSVALVVYPSSGADAPGLVPRRWRAALLFGIAGWLGSALGVGMAQSLHRIPPWFLVATGLAIVAGQLARAGGRWAGLLRTGAKVHAVTLALGAAAILVHALRPEPPVGSGDAIERGRRVYISEGCIHCHSQYIRPRSRDPELWGPYRAPDGEASPPLYGNRRQGPDLSNAGARRSAAWHRVHLVDPGALVAASRMPSYAYLFADGSSRGDDLVAYLASLGSEASADWYRATRRTAIGDVLDDVLDDTLGSDSAARGEGLFRSHCAPCHGPQGRGDGPLAADLARPAPPPRAMNLRKGPLWLVSWGPDAPPQRQSLAQLIRYGMPGTSMPGHETLDDREVADLVAYVQVLVSSPIASNPPAETETTDDEWLR